MTSCRRRQLGVLVQYCQSPHVDTTETSVSPVDATETSIPLASEPAALDARKCLSQLPRLAAGHHQESPEPPGHRDPPEPDPYAPETGQADQQEPTAVTNISRPSHTPSSGAGLMHNLGNVSGPMHTLVNALGPMHTLGNASGPMHTLGNASGPMHSLGNASGHNAHPWQRLRTDAHPRQRLNAHPCFASQASGDRLSSGARLPSHNTAGHMTMPAPPLANTSCAGPGTTLPPHTGARRAGSTSPLLLFGYTRDPPGHGDQWEIGPSSGLGQPVYQQHAPAGPGLIQPRPSLACLASTLPADAQVQGHRQHHQPTTPTMMSHRLDRERDNKRVVENDFV